VIGELVDLLRLHRLALDHDDACDDDDGGDVDCESDFYFYQIDDDDDLNVLGSVEIPSLLLHLLNQESQ
jgi:hypothetical protein